MENYSTDDETPPAEQNDSITVCSAPINSNDHLTTNDITMSLSHYSDNQSRKRRSKSEMLSSNSSPLFNASTSTFTNSTSTTQQQIQQQLQLQQQIQPHHLRSQSSSSTVAGTEFRQMVSVLPSAQSITYEHCQCNLIFNLDSTECEVCKSNVPILLQHKQINSDLRFQLETLSNQLSVEKEKKNRAVEESAKHLTKIAELEIVITRKEEENSNLRKDMHRMSEKLVKELEIRANIEAELEKTREEVEDLTRSLFEQANGMVAGEARKRHEIELREKQVLLELNSTKKKLESEQKEVAVLRKKLSEVSINQPERPSLSQNFQKFLSSSRSNSLSSILSPSRSRTPDLDSSSKHQSPLQQDSKAESDSPLSTTTPSTINPSPVAIQKPV